MEYYYFYDFIYNNSKQYILNKILVVFVSKVLYSKFNRFTTFELKYILTVKMYNVFTFIIWVETQDVE